MNIYRLNNNFLKNLPPAEMAEIDRRLVEWGLGNQEFEDRLDRWFDNFEYEADQRLALKLLLNLDYFSESRFRTLISNARAPLKRHLIKNQLTESDVIIVVPNDLGDSATRHAYDVHKVWEMPKAQIMSLRDFENTDLSGKALIFFNDTHGSGNQFFREIWKKYDIPNCGSRLNIVVAANIAESALKRFNETDNLIVWPVNATASVQNKFDFKASEVERLEELGKKVYPAHPLGYGRTGLLVAYYFQCPNNTLPLIWADGKNNGSGAPDDYQWSPLFSYRPKISEKQAPTSEVTNREIITLSAEDLTSSPTATSSGNNIQIKNCLENFVKQLNNRIAQTTLIPLRETPSALKQLDFFTNVVASPVHPTLGVFEESNRQASVFRSFGEAFIQLEERVLLLGVPGAGKTTTLFQFARDAYLARLADPTKPIPYFISIQRWDHKTPLHEWVRSQKPDLSKLLPETEQLLYIFDGLDELGGERPSDPDKPNSEKYDPRARFLEAVAEQLPDAKVVISCREQDYIQLGTKASLNGAIKLLPLEADSIQQVLVDKGQENLWQTLAEDPALLELSRTPLLLTLLSSAVGNDKGQIHIRHGDVTAKTIFDYYVDTRYRHEATKGPLEFDLNTTHSILQKLAAYRWLSGVGETESMTLFHPEIEKLVGERWKQFLKLTFALNFLRPISPFAVQFIHLKFRDYCALPVLLETLNNKSSGVRSSCAFALGEIKDLATVPALLKALGDEDSEVRSSSALALGMIKTPVVIPALLRALNDEDIEVRWSTIQSLGMIKDPITTSALIKSLDDEDSYVRSGVVEALERIKDPATIPTLLKALNDNNSYVRWTTVRALGEIKDPTTIPALLNVLNDENDDVRSAVVEALGEIKDPAIIPVLLNVLNDENNDVSWMAARMLGRIKDPTTIPVLLKALSDEDSDVRSCAAIALGEIKDPTTTPMLLKALSDEDSDVRSCAAIALGEIKDPTTIPVLLKALSDEDSDVRSRAALTLGEIKDPTTTPVLLKALSDEDREVRSAVVGALGEIKDPTTIPMLLKALNDEDRKVRSAVVGALGEIKDPTTIPMLLKALSDEDNDVNSGAIRALKAMKNPATIPALLKTLNSENRILRWVAVQAIGEIRDPSATDALLGILNHADRLVRSRAAKALSQVLTETDWHPETIE